MEKIDISSLISRVNNIESIMKVLASHIEILEKRNRKFTDKFKFGRFKFKFINDELSKVDNKKSKFCFNDD